MPSGVPTATPMTVMIRLPTIAFKRPPALPGGGVFCVKTATDSPANPFQNSTTRIMNNPIRPMAAAATLRPIHMAFRRRRAG